MQTTKQKEIMPLIVVATCLTMIGFLTIYAASAMKGAQQYDESFIFLKKQIFAGVMGLAMAAVVLKIPFSWFDKLTVPLLVFTIVSLILVFVPGLTGRAGGAARWVNLIVFRFQPSELAKIAFVFFLAKNLSRPGNDVNDFKKGLLPNIIVFGLFTVLLLKQPDLGSVILLGSLLAVMLYGSGLKLKYLLASFIVAMIAVAGLIVAAPYRMKRMLSFLDPWSQIREGGFQIIQSLLAFQNGGIFGVGLGESKQKLYFLPEAHTDFILAVLGEELGLLGLFLICGLFFYLCKLGYKITLQQKTAFRKHLAFGLTTALALQAIINMCVAMGLLPTKGMPLPFISSGANSLIASILMTAMLVRLSLESVANGK